VSTQTVKVPDIGAEQAEVIEVCVAPGDQVEPEQPLVVLESDKASVEIPSPVAGTITDIKVSQGDQVSEGAVILEVEVAGEGAVDDSTADAAPEPDTAPTEPVAESVSAEAAPAAAASKSEAIIVPDFGSESAEIIELSVGVGDEVSEGDSLIVLETDKASVEIPAPATGKVTELSVQVGDEIKVGQNIGELLSASAAISAEVPAQVQAAVAEVTDDPRTPEERASLPTSYITEPPPPPSDPIKRVGGVHAGPAVRLLAREFGVDLALVEASGPRGRILKEDVQAYVKQQLASPAEVASGGSIPPMPDVDFSEFGDVTVEPMSRIHKVTAANMQRNWLHVPHVTQFDDADITDLEQFRNEMKPEAERRGVKVTPVAFIIKACAIALRVVPQFNVSLHNDGEQIIRKDYVHIGLAVDTPSGLMVPVVRDADTKGLWDIAADIGELSIKAREGKLRPADMQGGCFTVSSLGAIGGTGFTPIVNSPEIGILGVSKAEIKPVYRNNEFVPRKMLPVSLSYDHRAVNGADAGRFLTQVTSVLGDLRRMLL